MKQMREGENSKQQQKKRTNNDIANTEKSTFLMIKRS